MNPITINFIMRIDWITRETVKQGQNGIQWTFTKQLDDLDFADICLLSHSHKHMQKKSSKLILEAEKTGLKINIEKTKLLKVNSTQQAKVQLKGKYIEEDNKFTYLGSVVTDKGGTDEDVKDRIGKARHAFSILKSFLNKIRFFNTDVKSVLLYGSETWRVTKTTTGMLQTFINKCLRYILKTKWQDTTTNIEIWRRTDQQNTRREIARRKWTWIGHTLRKQTNNVTRQALDWNPQGKQKTDRPKITWRRSIDEEVKKHGTTCTEMKKAANNRVRWKRVILAL